VEFSRRRTDIPLLLLYNMDPAWELGEAAAALAAVEKLGDGLRREGHPVVDVPVNSADLTGALEPFSPYRHIVLNWCEELPGLRRSDARVVQMLESLKFAYTGSPPKVLTFSWDKSAVKALLHRNGIPTPRWRLYSWTTEDGWKHFPAIVKPACEHSSAGITSDAVVFDPRELKERVTFVQDVFHQPALVEDFIDGREFHVTLWGNNGTITMLPPAEMDFSAFDRVRDRLCTFDSKFTPGSVHFEKIEVRVPAVLNESLYARLQDAAVQTYRVVGCRDYARIDLRLQNGVFYVLDVNPNADISSDTSLVHAAQAAGFTYGALGSQLVNFAAQRHPLFRGDFDVSA
jgi:D-alanine-D-alanine ligase